MLAATVTCKILAYSIFSTTRVKTPARPQHLFEHAKGWDTISAVLAILHERVTNINTNAKHKRYPVVFGISKRKV